MILHLASCPFSGVSTASYAPNGLEIRGCCTLEVATAYSLYRIYHNQPQKDADVIARQTRNQSILLEYQTGYTLAQLADSYGLSIARVHQIVND
jgi:hypothetical protein